MFAEVHGSQTLHACQLYYYSLLRHIQAAHEPHKHKQLQEAQLSPSDRAMRLVSSRPNLDNYHATVQKLLILQVLTKPMV